MTATQDKTWTFYLPQSDSYHTTERDDSESVIAAGFRVAKEVFAAEQEAARSNGVAYEPRPWTVLVEDESDLRICWDNRVDKPELFGYFSLPDMD